MTHTKRKNSAVVVGGLLGDEGKGRVTDNLIEQYLKKHKKAIVYRDNGGANAGHTVSAHGKKIALHQLGSGILHDECIIVLGKGMVLHPEDLVSEILEVKKLKQSDPLNQIKIDQHAVLSLDTHRAFEGILKQHHGSGAGSTGRGISPAYADIIYRHPLRMRDLVSRNWKKKFSEHYDLYNKLIAGFTSELKKQKVTRLKSKNIPVGTKETFLNRLAKTRTALKKIVVDLHPFLTQEWNSKTPFVFEKAQALGIDIRWGVYPDITASNCAPDGITAATEGIVQHNQIAETIAVCKSTYTSSVGSRVMPTKMDTKLAQRIRDDANEYGTTTGRPRDIIHLDLPMLSFLCKVGEIQKLAYTHMDVCYKDVPIKVCVAYEIDGKKVPYRPDQEFLNQVTPVYKTLKPWDVEKLKSAKKYSDFPTEAKKFIEFVSQKTNTKPYMITTGPERSACVII